MKNIINNFRQIKKWPSWWYFFLYFALKFNCLLLMRRRIIDPNNLIKTAKGCVTVTWHNRLLYFPAIFPRSVCKRTVAVVSASRDGQYVSDLISFFGIKSMRGSSMKRGANALRGAIRALNDGYNVSFTPDGPRGPKYTMSRGPIHLASTQGAKLIPVSLNFSRYWAFNSWDNFQIPKPFSTITLILGDPIDIPPNLDEAGLEEWRLKAEQALMAITED